MKRNLILLCLSAVLAIPCAAQQLVFKQAKFKTGDNMAWKSADFDDSSWRELSLGKTWDSQGVSNNDNFAWYRIRFELPKSMLDNSDLKETMRIDMGKIDDADEVYLNGVLIGKTGRMPQDDKGYLSAWDANRVYNISAKNKAIRYGAENVIAVRVYNGGVPGGMFKGYPTVYIPSLVDELNIGTKETTKDGKHICSVQLTNSAKKAQKGNLSIEVIDFNTDKQLKTFNNNVTVKAKGSYAFDVEYENNSQLIIKIVYTDKSTGRKLVKEYSPKYILTPAAPESPRYNGPLVYGVRPGSPIIFKIPTSGLRPMKFSVENLPEGMKLDAEKGILSGSISECGQYDMQIKATNSKGAMTQEFKIIVGYTIGLTPPMGWNSWNCWGLSVSQEKVISSAQAILDKGLADYGYSYINVDDAWEAAERNADGTIATNEKFPDMAGLGKWLHDQGLKFGIYSSPGDRTCGNYLGSLGHEKQDAETYNSWGVDYLKYDWCGYNTVFMEEKDVTVAAYVRPYLLMQKYLRQQPRDIFYSLCQYGMADVWKWGHAVDANSWRTTGDIVDTWESMYDIGFVRQRELSPYAQPGHWNDPDMLIVGKVGWSANLRDSRLTPDEQYTHISLWALLASNMLIGCDVAQIDDFTLGLLCNNEVNAVNQDILGKQAKCEVEDGDIQIWKRPLNDGTYAIGIFNLGTEKTSVDLSKYLSKLGMSQLKGARDLWQQKDLDTSRPLVMKIASHGVKMLKIK